MPTFVRGRVIAVCIFFLVIAGIYWLLRQDRNHVVVPTLVAKEEREQFNDDAGPDDPLNAAEIEDQSDVPGADRSKQRTIQRLNELRQYKEMITRENERNGRNKRNEGRMMMDMNDNESRGFKKRGGDFGRLPGGFSSEKELDDELERLEGEVRKINADWAELSAPHVEPIPEDDDNDSDDAKSIPVPEPPSGENST